MRSRMYCPAKDEFCRMAERGNLIPVYKEIFADLLTPASAFLKIDAAPFSYLLESVEGGEKWGRYSFLGSRPSVVISGGSGGVEVSRDGKREVLPASQDPLQALKGLMAAYTPVAVSGLPRFFGGAVGYLGYDLVRSFETLPSVKKDGLGLPDLFFLITDTLLIFDNVKRTIKVLSNAMIGKDKPEEAYEKAVEKIEEIIARLRSRGGQPGERKRAGKKPLAFSSTMAKSEFEKMVVAAKNYIHAGDVIQAVLSQRFEAPVRSRPFDMYRALRAVNPSPYMYYLRLDDLYMIGSSPEVLVRCEEGKIELRPIAGTRRRGETEEEDETLMAELLSDEKERAEHIMLVDLGRNDVGRVSETGRVAVDELMVVEKYSHVMHLVSHIQGRLTRGSDVYDVMRACFPAGTVTGAPKIRAMEIIDELEPTRRGPYGGAVGYFSFSGNMDTCINIRTILVKDGKAYIQAGAGIVADSVPEREYEETVNKAKALMTAIEMSERGLG